jgi:hypothetical protein
MNCRDRLIRQRVFDCFDIWGIKHTCVQTTSFFDKMAYEQDAAIQCESLAVGGPSDKAVQWTDSSRTGIRTLLESRLRRRRDETVILSFDPLAVPGIRSGLRCLKRFVSGSVHDIALLSFFLLPLGSSSYCLRDFEI